MNRTHLVTEGTFEREPFEMNDQDWWKSRERETLRSLARLLATWAEPGEVEVQRES